MTSLIFNKLIFEPRKRDWDIQCYQALKMPDGLRLIRCLLRSADTLSSALNGCHTWRTQKGPQLRRYWPADQIGSQVHGGGGDHSDPRSGEDCESPAVPAKGTKSGPVG